MTTEGNFEQTRLIVKRLLLRYHFYPVLISVGVGTWILKLRADPFDANIENCLLQVRSAAQGIVITTRASQTDIFCFEPALNYFFFS